MTPDQLTAALDAMQQAAGGDAERVPGLITVNSAAWCDSVYAIERITKTLDEGIRQSLVLTRGEAGDRGAPYQELTSGR